jgi:A/G-specific adenine glycosylase
MLPLRTLVVLCHQSTRMPRRPLPLPAAQIRRPLLRWYDRAKRDLPWRGERDPYRVWVSEIMLQQTRVAVVIPYYDRFIRRFPTVRDLAEAGESEVLALWSGLGYYRRARMLHQAAKQVVTEHDGRLPASTSALRRLAGIGRYTAAAIASICFAERAAVVDGNVERVLERLHGRTLSAAEHWEEAGKLISPSRPGDFNQAMMELGATVCTPASPQCGQCPLRALCRQKGTLGSVRRSARRKRRLIYVLDTTSDRVRLVQRKNAEPLMPNMWELPAGDDADDVAFRLRHSITSTDYAVEVRHGRARAGKYVALSQLAHLPLTGLTRKILRKAELLKEGSRDT